MSPQRGTTRVSDDPYSKQVIVTETEDGGGPRLREGGAGPSQKRHGTMQDRIVFASSHYGLLAILVLLIGLFSVLLPHTFPTAFTARSIFATKAIGGLVALAVMVPLATGQFDLSVGYMITISDVIVVGLQVNQHVPWQLAALIVLCGSAVLGLLNGILVTKLGIDAFIATLGTGTILYGAAEWYSGGSQIAGNLAHGFTAATGNVGPIPAPALYLGITALVLWVVTEHSRPGRLLYVTGSSPRAAVLMGIRTDRVILAAFVTSSVLSCVAGLVLASELAVGNSSIGPEYLLQAYAAAFLGATTIRPGRVNAWGTVVAVFVLAVLVAGLQQMGAKFYIESLFDGGILLVAVGLSVFASRRARTAD